MAEVQSLGFHIDPSTAWVAAVDTACDLLDAGVDRIELPAGVGSPERALAEFHESAAELIRRHDPAVVAILEAGTSQNRPPAASSRGRGRLEGALMLAAEEASVPVAWITHAEVSRVLGARPADRALAKQLAERLDGSTPVRWGDRAKAFAAALVALDRGHRG